jgi:hypothetical protein
VWGVDLDLDLDLSLSNRSVFGSRRVGLRADQGLTWAVR